MPGCIAYAKKDRSVRPASSGYVDFGTLTNINFERTDSFTLYCWIRFTQTGVGIVFQRAGNAAAGRGYGVSVNSAKIRLFLRSANSPNALAVETTAAFNDGKWHSVVVTYAGTSVPSGVHIYVDGNDEALTTVTNTLSATTAGSFVLYAGRDVVQSTFDFTGDIGGIAIFSGVLGSTDRATLYNGRKPASKTAVNAISGLLRYWRMGNGSTYPTIADDKTSGSSTGTMTGLSASDLRAYAPPYA